MIIFSAKSNSMSMDESIVRPKEAMALINFQNFSYLFFLSSFIHTLVPLNEFFSSSYILEYESESVSHFSTNYKPNSILALECMMWDGKYVV
jgi:hypothetical protein